MRLPTAKYEVYMQRLFYWLGSSIGRHPWKYIGGLLLITGISALGFLRFNQINNARITFTDSEAMSRYEGRIVERFLKQNGTLHMIEVMISAADNGSLLRPDFLEQLDNFSDELSNQLTVRDEHNQEVTFREMCDPYCQRNDPFFAVIKMLRNNVSEAEITYPVMEFLGQRVFIGSNFYGVTTDQNTTNMEDFKTVILHYFLVHDEMSTMIRWEDAVVNLCYESHKYGLLRASTASDHLVAKEVRAMGTKTAPLLAVALFILMIFLVICSFRYTRRESKPLEAMLGGITPILAAVTTVGMVSATGYAFQSIVVSTMFLLLAIGIDDVFIMLAAWHRTDKCKDVPTRMAEMLREAGCSMTVTSVTNFISFGNGVLSTTPVLQCFAIYSTVASLVCFIYQLILFPAVLALNAHKEQKGEEEECKACLPEKIEAIRHAAKVHDVIFKGLAKVVCSWWMAVLTILALSCYWALSVYGIMTVKTELGIQHLAPPDSRISQFKTEYEFVIKSMQTLGIVVQHPGDLRDPNNMKNLKQMIRDFETEKYSYGHDSTFCFLDAYEDYLRFYRAEGDEDTPVNFTYVDFPEFVDDETTKHFRATLKLNESACKEDLPECLDSFLFSTGFTTVSYYSEMYPVIVRWRAISEKYPQFGVVSYTERHNFADQSASLDSVIWQTAYSEVLCMALSFIIFIPDLTSIVAGMFAMISVNLGVLGFLSLWGVMIDPFSMASLLMSIGFSVDITSHISYHYYEVPGSTPRQKLEQTFLHIGWPTIQGAMSTFVAMVFVLMKPSHLGTVFFKTITLVMIFGLLHGLIILPVFLSLFDKLFKRENKVTLSDALNSSGQQKISPHQISIKSFTQLPDERF